MTCMWSFVLTPLRLSGYALTNNSRPRQTALADLNARVSERGRRLSGFIRTFLGIKGIRGNNWTGEL